MGKVVSERLNTSFESLRCSYPPVEAKEVEGLHFAGNTKFEEGHDYT